MLYEFLIDDEFEKITGKLLHPLFNIFVLN